MFDQQLRTGAYQLLANYQVAGHIAGTYVIVSRKHIMPGVKELNRLALEGSSETMQTNIDQIATFAKKAQSQISKLADEVSHTSILIRPCNKTLTLHQRRETIQTQLIDTKRQIIEEQESLEITMNATVEEASESEDEWDSLGAPPAPVVYVAAA